MLDPFESMQSSIDRDLATLQTKRELLLTARCVDAYLRTINCHAQPLPDFESLRVDWRTDMVRLSVAARDGTASLSWTTLKPAASGRVAAVDGFALPPEVVEVLKREFA